MRSLQAIMQGSNESHSETDFALLNLQTARALPGSQGIDIKKCLRQLDHIAECVRRETPRYYSLFVRQREEFNNSESVFKANVLITVLQRDLGFRYNPDLIERDDFFCDSRNLFIHGVLETRMGTCSSLPPFYLAVGRRLGYPLKLVSTTAHLFVRWDDPDNGETFNIECTSQGFVSNPDEYYLQWPKLTSKEQAERFRFLKSKTPREELAVYLATRGHCLLDNCHFEEAARIYGLAFELAENPLYQSAMLGAMNRWFRHLNKQHEGDLPEIRFEMPVRQFQKTPFDLEHDFVALHCLDDWLRKRTVAKTLTPVS